MPTRSRFRAIRRSLIARTFALVLIALGVTPFTAPFAVFDFADLTSTPSNAQDTASNKDFKEGATVDIVTVSVDFTLHVFDLRPEPLDRRELRLSRSLVLRI